MSSLREQQESLSYSKGELFAKKKTKTYFVKYEINVSAQEFKRNEKKKFLILIYIVECGFQTRVHIEREFSW